VKAYRVHRRSSSFRFLIRRRSARRAARRGIRVTKLVCRCCGLVNRDPPRFDRRAPLDGRWTGRIALPSRCVRAVLVAGPRSIARRCPTCRQRVTRSGRSDQGCASALRGADARFRRETRHSGGRRSVRHHGDSVERALIRAAGEKHGSDGARQDIQIEPG
jgi:hypothetical protein